jgi:integrating conjugative element membrane protein (TIGR03747 family)
LNQGHPFIHDKLHRLQKGMTNTIWPLLLSVTQLIWVKLSIWLLSLPLLLLMIVLGVIDGLVQRDIRKFQGARESTFFFHTITKQMKLIFFIPVLLYLIWPWPLRSMWVLIPWAIGLGILMQNSVRTFKKYV